MSESRVPDTPAQWKEHILTWGREFGLDRIAIARAHDLIEPGRRLREWLERGYHAEMGWMARAPERRYRIEEILPEARSVITAALVYLPEEPNATPPKSAQATPARGISGERGPTAPASSARTGDSNAAAAEPGRIARYARGLDYHEVLGRKLHALRDKMLAHAPALRTRIACDTSAVLDKAFAAEAGLGWVGKNTCLLHPQLGSWFFVGEIFTDLELPPDDPIADRCGSCTRCLDACPTDAFPEPYVLDSNRCIAYRNIEHRGPFPDGWAKSLGDWLVGCDICQEVCPWNRKVPSTEEPEFRPLSTLIDVSPAEWEAMDDGEIRGRIRKTAVSRIKPPDLRRNARAVRENRIVRSAAEGERRSPDRTSDD